MSYQFAHRQKSKILRRPIPRPSRTDDGETQCTEVAIAIGRQALWAWLLEITPRARHLPSISQMRDVHSSTLIAPTLELK